MERPSDFHSLLLRVRAGEPEAAEELVRNYELDIRRIIRVRLTDPNLRRTIESVDIFQSVMAQFFVRVRMGQFDLAEPKDLVRLLATMVKNKVLDKARKPANRRTVSAEVDQLDGLPDRSDSPSEVVSCEELVATVKGKMTADERAIATARLDGCSWDEIANTIGISSDAASKRLKRALDRILLELGVEK